MKNQRMNCQRKFQPVKLVVLMAMLLVVTCLGGVIAVSGAQGPVPVIDGEVLTELTYDPAAGCWVMTYDGDTAFNKDGVSVTLPTGQGTAVVTEVKALSADATTGKTPNTSIRIDYTVNGVAQDPILLPLRIEPKELTWSAPATTGDLEYKLGEINYSDIPVLMEGVTLQGIVDGDEVTVGATQTVSFSAINVTESMTVYARALVEGADLGNYIVPLLPVKVSITPVALGPIEWSGLGTHTFGDDKNGNNVYDALDITAKAPILGTTQYIDLPVMVYNAADETFVPIAEAYEKGLYGQVLKSDPLGKTAYTVAAGLPNGMYCFADESSNNNNQTVTIARRVYQVAMLGGEYLTQLDLSDPNKVEPLVYQTLVTPANGDSIPADVLARITYSYVNDATGKVVSANGVSAAGNYTVTATMPTIVDGNFQNYEFDQDTISVSLVVKKNYIIVGTADEPYQLIIVGENGINSNVTATLTIPDAIDRKAIYGYHIHKDYTLQIHGGAGQSFRLILPIASIMAEDPNCDPLKIEDLYLYDGAGNMAPANGKYTVTLSENGAYYIIEGFNTDTAVTFIIAPEYEAPFWVTAPGIALIILIVLLVLLALFLIGLKLRQIERSDADNKVLVIDTEGDVPPVVPVVVPDKIEDPDAVLAESIDDLADALRPDVAPEEEEIDMDVDASEAVAEARAEINEEIEAIDLTADREAEVAAATELTENMAEELAGELRETVPAEDGVGDISDEVNAAVAEAMAENFNESADAADAVEVEEVVEEAAEEVIPVVAAVDTDDDNDDDENDNDDDDEGDSFGGFGGMPLTFIDAVAEAEKYNEMLDQESRGEVQLVARYRRSYQSRLSQAQGSVPDYYNVIKNLLLSYKGVKNRISWNYETFNVGRTPVAKFNAKTRTLYVYMSLNPEELAETKYTFNDMSSKKKYASVPVLMKIKGDRKFKHAMEMITMLCEEKLQLPKKKVIEEQDYKIPYMTTEQLVAEGMVKKLVAAIPLVDLPTEETPVEEAPVEETPVEETPVEETPAEEIAVEAPVETDTTEA